MNFVFLFRSAAGYGILRNLFTRHFVMQIGQAEVAALEAAGEAFVVDAEQVQDGGLHGKNGNILLIGLLWPSSWSKR